MKDTEEARALKIAAKILQAVGLCRYDSGDRCRRTLVNCEQCIEAWLLEKARDEIKKEERE